MGPKSNSASHCCLGARASTPEDFRRLKVEPDASTDQLLTNLFIAGADIQSHIVEEFVLNECAATAYWTLVLLGTPDIWNDSTVCEALNRSGQTQEFVLCWFFSTPSSIYIYL